MGIVREVYERLVKVTRCKNCHRELCSKVTTCENGHTVCQQCCQASSLCAKCNSQFFDNYHVFYNKVIAALNDRENYLEKLYDMLECPVCYEPLTCPSWTCWNGHMTCGRCYFYTSTCPLCREEFTNLYNTDLNILLSVLESPIECVYKEFGCRAKERYVKLKQHEDRCAYRQYDCLIEGCQFASYLSKLPDHVWNTHPKEVIKLDRSSNCTFEAARDRRVKLILSGLQSYWLITERDQLGVRVKLVQLGYKLVAQTAVLSVRRTSSCVHILPVQDLDTAAFSSVPLPPDSTSSKTITCNLSVNTKKSSWLVNTMFVAALAANLTFAVIILKNIK